MCVETRFLLALPTQASLRSPRDSNALPNRNRCGNGVALCTLSVYKDSNREREVSVGDH